jgi:predicted helicase
VTALHDLLDRYRAASLTHREEGTYFEELTVAYLKNEPSYRELYKDVVPYAVWAERQGLDRRDAGIDLVAETVNGEVHAIQCKLYAPDHRVQKSDIDSFFTASGKKPFTRRILVATTNLWSEHAEDALRDQQPPVTKIDLLALENSVIDWSRFAPRESVVVRKKKTPRPHQLDALNRVAAGLETLDRGKLIMACGTGKTFTALKIAEKTAGPGKRVLFLVPSLALLSQTLTEWTQESETPLQSYAVCSDGDVGKKRRKDDDVVQTFAHELQYPATTDAAHLAREMSARHDAKHMSVVYATYHSIDVLHHAQKDHGLPGFDLIVCDEAHRTTGARFADEDESHFIKVHSADFILGKKRLYMTATPSSSAGPGPSRASRRSSASASRRFVASSSSFGRRACRSSARTITRTSTGASAGTGSRAPWSSSATRSPSCSGSCGGSLRASAGAGCSTSSSPGCPRREPTRPP